LIEKLLMSRVIAIRLFFPDQIKELLRDGVRHDFMDSYVLIFATLVTIVLFIPSHCGVLGVSVAAYRNQLIVRASFRSFPFAAPSA